MIAEADLELLRERLETLYGVRSREAKPRQAVRIEDIQALQEIPETLASAQITAAPTQADYNALQDDIAAIHSLLLTIAQVLQGKII